jgi:glycosyltransferase involved in cell wall biosynthesis
VPLVVHGEHGTLQLKARQRWLQRLGWSGVDQHLSVSSRLAERIERETGFPVERIRTIRNGVDLSRFARIDRHGARTSLGLSADTLVAVTIGRLVPVKDHDTLLQAVAQVRAHGIPVTMAIAGDGPLKDQLTHRAAALGLKTAVRFLGYRSDAETVLAAADLFVLSSESEGLSNPILEAMATGLPVVATNVGGADELVEEGVTGRLVSPRSPVALADAMVSMLADPQVRRAMGEAGRMRAEGEFSLEVMIQRYQTMYCEVAIRAGSRVAGVRQSEVV